MRKGKGKFIIIFIILLCVVAASCYFLFIKENGVFNRSNEVTVEETEVILDNRNGIYLYTYIPDEFLKVSSGCTVTKIDYYMVIINKNWYSYKSSCMGTYQLGNGEVEKLDIKYNSERNEYSFNYDNKRYVKNPNLLSVTPNETFKVGTQNVSLDGYKLLAKETMYTGHYYVFDRYISDFGGSIMFGKEHESEPYRLTIGNVGEPDPNKQYVYSSYDIDDFPNFIIFNKKLSIREKYTVWGRTNYTLKLFELNKGVVYDLNNVFPITVNGVQLSNNNNYVYLDNNVNRNYYIMLIGSNPNFCVEGSTSDNVAFYEFKVEFDYNNYSFKTPSFVRAWYEKEGCSYVNKVMEG